MAETFSVPSKTGTKDDPHDLVIIGAGPAALSAAIYTSREDIETTLIEKGAIGGLAAVTDWIDNYPGFAEGVSGLDLSDAMRAQAERFGARIELDEVMEVAAEGDLKKLKLTGGDKFAKAILIATGNEYKKIGIPGEQEYYARGVHYCATCDGAFYRDKKLVVVGGGNSAVQESIFLTKFATHIDILVRGPKLKASEVLQHQLKEHADKITVHFNTTSDKIVGHDGKVISVTGTDTQANKPVEYECDGVFVFVGLKPNTDFLAGSGVELDEKGFVVSNEHLGTSVLGIFTAGDVRSGATEQIASASGEGATAALTIREYLDHMPARKHVDQPHLSTHTDQRAYSEV
jgi:thioredoxin reductase (NADPH)